MKTRKKISARLLAIMLIAALLLPLAWNVPVEAAETKQIDVLFSHDTHSHLNSFSTIVDGEQKEVGGFARIKTLIDEKKQEDPDTLVLDGGDFYLTALRGTKKQFTGKCLLESAWKAFLCVGSGIVLYIVLVAVKFLPLDAYVNDVSESMIAMVYGETLLQRIGWLLLAIVHTGLLAAVFAITALVLTVLWGDSFFAISSLVLLEYFSKKLASGYVGVVYERYESGGLTVPFKARLVDFLFPSNHLFYDRSFQYEFGVSYWGYAIFISLWMGGIAFLFYWQVRRRNA